MAVNETVNKQTIQHRKNCSSLVKKTETVSPRVWTVEPINTDISNHVSLIPIVTISLPFMSLASAFHPFVPLYYSQTFPFTRVFYTRFGSTIFHLYIWVWWRTVQNRIWSTSFRILIREGWQSNLHHFLQKRCKGKSGSRLFL